MKYWLLILVLFCSLTILQNISVLAQPSQTGQQQGMLGFSTPTPTRTPTPTQTPTAIPTATHTPIPTATSIPRLCGEQCENISCANGFTCIQAKDNKKYCAKSNVATILDCTFNPSQTTCCDIPTSTPTITPLPTLIKTILTATPSLIPTKTKTPTPSPTQIPSVTPTPTRVINMNCDPDVTELNPKYTYNGMELGLGIRPDLDHISYQWYYINYAPDVSATLKAVETIIANQTTILQNGDKKMSWDRDVAKFASDFDKYPGCPIRFTGSSPTLFVYGNEGSQMDISIGRDITYADPSLVDSTWNVSIGRHDLYVNHIQRPYIYYEYKKTDFKRPEKGWNIERRQLEIFADKLSRLLQLQNEETKRLIFELNHAASEVSESRIFIGLLDETEIQREIPLIIIPQPQKVARYHFYIGKVEDNVQAPDIKPLQRSTSMILELGAVGYGD